MIKAMDVLLIQWGEFRRTPDFNRPSAHPIALAMSGRGEIIRTSRRPSSPNDCIGDIELLYAKVLDPHLRKIVRLHYVNEDMSLSLKQESCSISSKTYYRRLDQIHATLAHWLIFDGRRVA